jgi:hypothetical protein
MGSMSDAPDEAPEIHACLAVEGTFDPDELSTLLGVKPDTEGRAGEKLRNGKSRERDSWHYRTKREHDWDWPRHLESVLAIVRPHAAAFREFCDAHQADREVHLVAYMTGATPIGAVGRDAIRELAEIGCGIDIDLYC